MKSNPDLEAYNKRVEEQNAAFRRCFNTPDGKLVLRALTEEFYDAAMEPGPGLEYKAGARNVIRTIQEIIADV